MKIQFTTSKCQQKQQILELDHQGRRKWNYQEQNKNSYVLNTEMKGEIENVSRNTKRSKRTKQI